MVPGYFLYILQPVINSYVRNQQPLLYTFNLLVPKHILYAIFPNLLPTHPLTPMNLWAMNEEQVKVVMEIFMSLILENGGDSYRSSFVFSFCYVFKESKTFAIFLNRIIEYGFRDLYMRLISHCETENYTSYSMMRTEMEKGRLGTDASVKYLNYVSVPYQHQL